jgi:hypothetical protein
MDLGRMVLLVTVPNSFHARVVAARLGAAGVVTELRGNVDGPYPIGDVHVMVPESELALARELLLADEVENALEVGSDGATDLRTPPALWVVLVVILLMAAVLAARHA